MILGDNVLRSAMASKLAYADSINKTYKMSINSHLHGSSTSHLPHFKPIVRECHGYSCKAGIWEDEIIPQPYIEALPYPMTTSHLVTQVHPHPHTDTPEIPADEIWFIHEYDSGVHAYAWKNGPNSLLIAFKGTSTLRDVGSFLDSSMVPFSFRDKTVRIHRGVLNMFKSIECMLNKELLDNMRLGATKYVTFCGHSLGGAIALLAAAYYGNVSNNNLKVSCHTFGALKVGDADFQDWLEAGSRDTLNIISYGDIIPMLPLQHAYNQNQSIVIKDGRIMKQPHNQIALYLSLLEIPKLFKSHDLDTYIEALRQNAELQKTPIL